MARAPFDVPREAVLRRLGDSNPGARLEKDYRDTWSLTPKQLREVWRRAKRQLEIPDAEPAPIVLEGSVPVGRSTPS